MRKFGIALLLIIAAVAIWQLSTPVPEVPVPQKDTPQISKPDIAPVAKIDARSSLKVKDGWGYYFSFIEDSTGKLMSGVSAQLLWKESDEQQTKDINHDSHAGFVQLSKDHHEFSLRFSHPTHYSEQRSYNVSLSPENPTATLEVHMILGETVSGRVYDAATDKGIEGVKVGVGRRKSPGAVTGETGNYRIGGVRSGRKQIFLDHAKGYIDPPNMRNGSLVDISKGQALTGVDFALDKGIFASIQGMVVNAEGKPVSGIKVQTISYDDTMTGYQSAEDISANDGSFLLEELLVDDGFYVTATSKGLISEEVGPLSLTAEGIKDLTLELIPTGSISGQVVDVNSGKPVTEPSFIVDVIHTWRGRKSVGGKPTNLNDDGHFTISELAADTYGLFLNSHPNVYRSGWVTAQIEVTLEAGEHVKDVKLTFDHKAYLKSKMASKVKKPTKAPKPSMFPEVKGQIVRTGSSDPVTAFDLKIMHKTMGETRSQRSIQHPKGLFTIKENQGHTLELDISAKGYAPKRVKYTLDNPNDFKSPLVISLDPGAELEGRVVDTDGNGIAGAKVFIGFNPALMESGGFAHPADTTTGTDGSFMLNTLTDSSTRIYAQHPTYAVGFEDITPTHEHSSTLDIVLTEGGIIEGVVKLLGEPIPNTFIMALDESGKNIEIENSQTDKEGRYRITRLAPGDYTVYTNINDFSRTIKVFAEVADGMVTDADILFDDSQHSLSGLITLNGETPWSLTVQANVQSTTGLETTSVRAKDSSTYTIENLPAGEAEINVYASLRDGSRAKSTFTLTIEEGNYTQDLQLISE